MMNEETMNKLNAIFKKIEIIKEAKELKIEFYQIEQDDKDGIDVSEREEKLKDYIFETYYNKCREYFFDRILTVDELKQILEIFAPEIIMHIFPVGDRSDAWIDFNIDLFNMIKNYKGPINEVEEILHRTLEDLKNIIIFPDSIKN